MGGRGELGSQKTVDRSQKHVILERSEGSAFWVPGSLDDCRTPPVIILSL